ncbi:thymidine phosphorylase [bacterium]|nr:thymidine phosphorylase [bacterium]
MTAYEIILKKRDKQELTKNEIKMLVDDYTAGKIPDYQMSAFLMAVYFAGMNFRETTDLTIAMRDSGTVIDLSMIPGKKVDKHSTGGVGDKISLILAPLAASLGVIVPMISGRGLGHTGGTLDKLESIPGFNIGLSISQFQQTLKDIGVCMIGQTAEIAPADKKLYALRDVTGTVESIPLISASIMSKKLAEGIDALVLDVKVGNGAFMKSFERAAELAKNLISIGENSGKSVIALLTNMDEPLGKAVGNWIEMRESIETLRGDGPDDLVELTAAFSAYMLILAKPELTYEEAYFRSKANLKNGRAYEKFLEIVQRHGGDTDILADLDGYPKTKHAIPITAKSDGFVLSINCLEVGMAGVLIGAGRRTKEDAIDYSSGIMIHKKVGDRVIEGEILATVYTSIDDQLESACQKIEQAYEIGFNAPDKKPLILAVMDRNGFRDMG